MAWLREDFTIEWNSCEKLKEKQKKRYPWEWIPLVVIKLV